MPFPRSLVPLFLLAALPFSSACTSIRMLEASPKAGAIPNVPTGAQAQVVAWSDPIDPTKATGAGGRVLVLDGVVESFSTVDRTLRIRADGVPWALSFDQVQDLKVLRDVKRPDTRRIERGWLGGGIVLGLFGLLSIPMQDRCSGMMCISEQDAMIGLGGLIGFSAALGGTIGGLLGSEEVWQPILLPEARPSVHLSRRGRLGLGLSVPVGGR